MRRQIRGQHYGVRRLGAAFETLRQSRDSSNHVETSDQARNHVEVRFSASSPGLIPCISTVSIRADPWLDFHARAKKAAGIFLLAR